MLTAILLGSAAACFAVAVVFGIQSRTWRDHSVDFNSRALATSAEVVDLVEREQTGRSGLNLPDSTATVYQRQRYFPVVRFTAPDGRLITTELLIGARPAPAKPGEIVEILFDRADPSQAVMATGLAGQKSVGCVNSLLPIMFGVLGGLLVLAWVLLKLVLKIPA